MSVTGDLVSPLRWFPLVFDVPLMRFLGVEPVDDDDPLAGLCFDATDKTLNAAGVLHGGAIAAVLDLAGYLCVLPTLGPAEQAVTHAFHAGYLTATTRGERLTAKGSLLRRGHHLAFTHVELTAGERLVATAAVTKSVITPTIDPGARS